MSSKNPFGNLKTDGLEEAQDRLGGGFQPRESGAYDFVIKAFYAGASDGGAQNVSIIVNDEKGEYRETIYITNKKGENWFLNKDDSSKKVPLPGFTTINDICLLATGFPLCDQEWDEKVINLYDYEQKKEVPKAVMMATSLIGQPITLGLLQTLKNKGVKQGDGSYIDGPEERTEVNIAKVFHTETKKTVAELNEGKDEAEFFDKWVEKNKGSVIDKRTIKDGQGGKTAQKTPPQAGAAGGAPKKSLFGNK